MSERDEIARSIREVIDSAAAEGREPSNLELKGAGIPKAWRDQVRPALRSGEEAAQLAARFADEIAGQWEMSPQEILDTDHNRRRF